MSNEERKPHLEFLRLNPDEDWVTPPGYPSSFQHKILTSDIDEKKKIGSRSRLMRLDPGAYSKAPCRCACAPVGGCRALPSIVSRVVVMHFEHHTTVFGFERAVMDTRWAARIGRGEELLAALAVLIVAYDQIAFD